MSGSRIFWVARRRPGTAFVFIGSVFEYLMAPPRVSFFRLSIGLQCTFRGELRNAKAQDIKVQCCPTLCDDFPQVGTQCLDSQRKRIAKVGDLAQLKRPPTESTASAHLKDRDLRVAQCLCRLLGTAFRPTAPRAKHLEARHEMLANHMTAKHRSL